MIRWPKFAWLSLLLVALPGFSAEELMGAQLLYLASTEDKSIVAYELDEQTGALKPSWKVDLPGNPGPLALSPNGRFLYAAMTGLKGGPEGNQAGVATLKRADDGSLELAATAGLTSRAPYIRTDKRGGLLLAAHYGEGEVTVQRIKEGICTDQLLDRHETERTAHCIELDPSGRFAFVPHTAPNKVYQFRLDADAGKLTANDPPFVAGPEEGHQYHAPRHYAHHPKLDVAYTSNEFGGGITAWKFDSDSGTLGKIETLSTLPPDYEGTSAAADIHVTPDGRFAYVSNRDTTDRGDQPPRDTLAAVALDAKTGRMKIVGHYPTAHFPRSFCLDLNGQYLVAVGQKSATMHSYRIDQQSGKLKPLQVYETGGAPIWVMFTQVR